jgi:hypothetical protein
MGTLLNFICSLGLHFKRAVAQILPPVARPAQDIFFGVRSNFIVLVKGKMFGIAPDRRTWMRELSCELFVNGAQCMLNIVPLLDLSDAISDLIPKKDVLYRPVRDQDERYLGNSP